jgi:hypothetical protein
MASCLRGRALTSPLDDLESRLDEPCTRFRDRAAWPPLWACNVCVNAEDGTLNFELFAAVMNRWRLAYDLASVEIALGDLRRARDEWPIDLRVFVDIRVAARFGLSVQQLQAARLQARC